MQSLITGRAATVCYVAPRGAQKGGGFPVETTRDAVVCASIPLQHALPGHGTWRARLPWSNWAWKYGQGSVFSHQSPPWPGSGWVEEGAACVTWVRGPPQGFTAWPGDRRSTEERSPWLRALMPPGETWDAALPSPEHQNQAQRRGQQLWSKLVD